MESSRPLRVLGIDPGINGSAAIYDAALGLVAVIDLPTRGEDTKREIDVTALCAFIGQAKITHAVIEYVTPMPSIPDPADPTGYRRPMGAATIGRFMRTVGELKATCEGCGFRARPVVPQVWKRLYGLNGQDKRASVMKARELFGEEAARRWFSRLKDENRAEAALIAKWLVDRPVPAVKSKRRAAPTIPLFDGLPPSTD